MAWSAANWIRFLCFVLAVMFGVIIWLAVLLSSKPVDEGTVVVSDEPIVIPEHEEKIDAFRATWNIFGRFEAWPTVLPLAKMCEISYEDPEQVSKAFEQFGFPKTVAVVSPLHSQVAFVASCNDVAVVIFRGTDDTEDWIININTYMHQTPDGGVHAGFSNAYSAMRQEIIAELKALKPKHLWISGHSLGGAMALVCAYDLVRFQETEISGIFTFGQPRVGRKQFASYLQNQIGMKYVHFVNELDGVPRLPTTCEHCGLFIWFKDGKVLKSESYKLAIAMTNDEKGIPNDKVEFIKDLPVMQEREFGDLQIKLKRFDRQLFPLDRLGPDELGPDKDAPAIDKVPESWRKPMERLQKQGESWRTWKFEPGNRDNIPFEMREYRPGVRIPVRFNVELPWTRDHGMAEYIQKIRSAIGRARIRE